MSRCFSRSSALALFALAHFAFALTPTDPLNRYGRQSWGTGSGLPQDTITALAQTSDGLLWIGTEEGLARFDGYGFLTFNSQNTPQLKSNSIRELWVDAGALYVATEGGSAVVRDGRFSAAKAQAPEHSLPALPDLPVAERLQGRVRKALVDRHGEMWLGTAQGLYRLREGKLEQFASGDVLSGASISALFEDREGNLWVGTEEAGLQMIKDQSFTTFTSDRIRSVFADAAGAVWLGTDGAGLKRIENGSVSTLSVGQGLSSNVILSLAGGRDKSLLIGTPDGLSVLKGSSVTTQTSADGLPEDFVRSLFVDADGTTWLGTRQGLAHIEHDQVTLYTQSNGLGSDLVGAIVRDKRGDLWVGTLRGLSRLRKSAPGTYQNFTNYTVANGLSSNVITDLYVDETGDLWIATQGGGLNRFRDEVFTRSSVGAVPETLYGVTADEKGHLWLAASNGIARFDKSDFGREHLSAVFYGASDGLRSAECSGGGHPALWKTPHGDIWFATARGGALLTAEHAGGSETPPKVLMEAVLVDDAPFSPASISEVEPGHSRISFQYAGIALADTQRIRYEYRLAGFDKSWIEAGARRTAFYTNLGPGTYRFEVRARNGHDVWSVSAAVYTFRVLPHLYQTLWFRLLLLLGLSGLVYAGYLWRVRQVQSEFRAVLSERTRIAREIHDTLAQGFAGVSVQLEVVSRLLMNSPGQAREHLDQARALARSCLEDARRSIWELRSQSAEREDLATRFSRVVRAASQNSSSLEVQFEVRGTFRPIDSRVEDEILRIGQEAIANAVRHSGARTITAALTYEATCVRLMVSDDGCGIAHLANNSPAPAGHYGLTGMRERAQSIDAEFLVESRSGSGTTISLEAPVR